MRGPFDGLAQSAMVAPNSIITADVALSEKCKQYFRNRPF